MPTQFLLRSTYKVLLYIKGLLKVDQDTCPNFGLQWKTKQRHDIGSSVARSNGQQFSFENN
jgi:hypothetical protein